jgi:hypothetical protein
VQYVAGPKTRALITALEETVSLLQGQGLGAHELERSLELLRRDDFEGVLRLLGQFGGMGSLNDIMLADPNVHERFDGLRHRLYDLARQVKHEATWE